jgi:hypothetical protein
MSKLFEYSKDNDPCPKCGCEYTAAEPNSRGFYFLACRECKHHWCPIADAIAVEERRGAAMPRETMIPPSPAPDPFMCLKCKGVYYPGQSHYCPHPERSTLEFDVDDISRIYSEDRATVTITSESFSDMAEQIVRREAGHVESERQLREKCDEIGGLLERVEELEGLCRESDLWLREEVQPHMTTDDAKARCRDLWGRLRKATGADEKYKV